MLAFIILCSFRIVSSYRYLPESNSPALYFETNRDNLNEYTASILDVPYHVLIVYGTFYCSGTLIRSKIAITAASCFLKDNIETALVKLGAGSINDAGQVIAVREIKKHEYFRHLNNMDNDIAMIILQDDVKFGEGLKKGILVDPEVAIRVGTIIRVHGWGSSTTSPKLMTKILVSEMMVIANNDCQKYHGHLLSPSNYCVKYQANRRIIDNGGSATYGDILVGILSFGAANKKEPFVAVMTNISYFHRWIQINSERFLRKYCKTNDDDTFNKTSEYGILSQVQRR